MENNEFLKVHFKNLTCYYFNGIGKLEDFNIDDILIEEKSHESQTYQVDKVDGSVRT